ncbi:MAG TPA: HAMP domain-containing sensor histidine kinase [Chloroflexota bacterium]|nr:HAMP domain-containing sensor histidine kinase [Chloroflexota bacterium]HUM67369.1 HAMP domain-containing sensor histidine kinase [Chloroflexota bacterium]
MLIKRRKQVFPELEECHQPVEDDVWVNELMSLNNELINLQRHLAKKNAALARLSTQKDQLFGMAAHELRNPMSIIMEYSEFLLRQDADSLTSQQRQFIETIHTTSYFMLKHVESFLDLSAIESGKLNLHCQPTDLALLIQRNLELNQMLATPRKISLHFQAISSLPPLWVDQGKIEQVLNNLLSNAMKYSLPDSCIQVQAKLTGEHVQVSVENQGQSGFEAELSRLFQPFSHTLAWPTMGETSTGLGLAISHRIIHEHGGEIWATSIPGRSMTVFFLLPVKSDATSDNLEGNLK